MQEVLEKDRAGADEQSRAMLLLEVVSTLNSPSLTAYLRGTITD